MFAIALCGLGFTKRRRVRMLLMVGAFALSLLNACGGGGSTPPPPVTSTITVTATSGSLQHSTTVLLTVR
jgi:hypothetical protein